MENKIYAQGAKQFSPEPQFADDREATAVGWPCPYCGGTSVAHVSASDVNRRVSTVEFHLHRCKSCGLLFLINPPADLGRYYPSQYHYVPKSIEDFERGLPVQQFKLDLLRRFKQHGALMDIGPSIGMFCRLAQNDLFDVSAIEMDQECVRYLREKIGVRTVQSDDPAQVLVSEQRTYDAICFWHSLEHLPTPWKVLEEAMKHLNPGGILIIAAPNPLGRQARLMGPKWPHHDLPRHLFGLPIPWVLAFAESHGLEPALVTTRDEGSLYWNRFSWGMRLRAWSNQSHLQSGLWKLGLLLGHLLGWWEGREGQGAAYTIVLRRMN